jgi:hypothetical protein
VKASVSIIKLRSENLNNARHSRVDAYQYTERVIPARGGNPDTKKHT